MARVILHNLIPLILGLIIILGGAEFYFRQTVRFLPPMARADPVTIFSLLPNLTVRDTSPGDFSVAYSTNSFGMRYREIAQSKPMNTLRVLALGDSFTFGVGVEANESFPSRLESKLASQTTQHVEVLNTGVTGYGTSHELAYLESEGFQFNPDLVVVGFYANDPDDSYGSGLYSIVNGALKRTPPDQVPQYLPERGTITQLPFYSYLANNSAFFAFLRQLYFLQRQADVRTDVEKNIYLATPSVAALTPAARPDIGLTRLLMARLREVTQAKKIPLIFLLIPYRWQPDADEAAANVNIAPIADICQSEKLNCINMAPILYRSGLPVDALYYTRNDLHWKPIAHQMAADALSNYISEHQLIHK